MSYCEDKEVHFRSADRNIIPVFNDGSAIIPGYTAAVVSRVRESGGIQVVCAAPAVSGEKIWGVTTADIIPGTWGNMVVNGVARAFISGGSGNYVVPSGNGLLAAANGRAQIIHRGTTEVPGVILLGAGDGGEEEYVGQFAVRYLENRTFKIGYPQMRDEYAGETDLPDVGGMPIKTIPVQTITMPSNIDSDNLYLYACFKDDVYSAVIQLEDLPKPEGWFDRQFLAYIKSDGYVQQGYRSFDGIEFGRRWFL